MAVFRSIEQVEFVETFIVRSWGEHMHQHYTRLTGQDRLIEEAVERYTDGCPCPSIIWRCGAVRRSDDHGAIHISRIVHVALPMIEIPIIVTLQHYDRKMHHAAGAHVRHRRPR